MKNKITAYHKNMLLSKRSIMIIFSMIILFLSSFYYFYIYTPNINNNVQFSLVEIEYLEQVDRILYAADQNSPPLRYVDKSDDQYKGVVIDYLSQLSLELGKNIDTKPLEWEDALNSLKSGTSQICDMFPNQERAKLFIFTKPIYNLRAAVAVKSDVNVNIEELFSNNIRLATQKGDYLNSYMNQNYPNVELVYTPDIESAFELLKNNKVDALAGDEPVISYFRDSVEYQDIKILPATLYENDVVFALPKNETILLSILNKGIDSINSKHQLEKIQQKWFGISAPITYSATDVPIKKYVLLAFIPFLILLVSVLYINNSLKKQVLEYSKKEQTRERISLQSSKMAAIGELASGMAHEIRNPLGIIRTHSFILKSNPDTDVSALNSIEYIDSSVERASRIIDNLLNFSKLSGENKENTDMKAFIENIVLLENKLLNERNINFELNCTSTIVPVNQESMKHITINLFSNAVDALCKYDSSGSYICNVNSCPKIVIDIYVDKESKSLRMHFTDNGIGLSKENADQIFNPFFTTKGPNKGTGLGLYIVYNEISKLGGKIWLESKINEGTTFFISLPLT